MGKKLRYKYLTGSLLEPLFQFSQKLQFGVNPISDPRGTQIANYWYRQSKQIKPKFKGQNFDSQITYDFETSSSYVVVNFVNGWKYGFYFREATNEGFTSSINYINRIVQYERALQGKEDEYEDQD